MGLGRVCGIERRGLEVVLGNGRCRMGMQDLALTSVNQISKRTPNPDRLRNLPS